jgi:hypothetical protein
MAWIAAHRTSIRTCEYRFFMRWETWPAIASVVSSDTSGFSRSGSLMTQIVTVAQKLRKAFRALFKRDETETPHEHIAGKLIH